MWRIFKTPQKPPTRFEIGNLLAVRHYSKRHLVAAKIDLDSCYITLKTFSVDSTLIM